MKQLFRVVLVSILGALAWPLAGQTATPPAISAQPQAQTVALVAAANLAVVATGSPAPTYQWRKDGVAISGATNAAYGIASVTAANAGSYDVVLTNPRAP